MKTFFLQPSSLTVREIANLTGAVPRDGARLDLVVTGIAALDRARSSDLMYLDNTKYGDRLATTRGGVCLTTDRFAEHAPPEVTVLCTAQPFRDFVVVSRKLFPDALRPRSLFDTEGVAPGAIVHPAAGLLHEAKRRGAVTAEINPVPTPASGMVDIAIQGPAEDVLPRLDLLLAS